MLNTVIILELGQTLGTIDLKEFYSTPCQHTHKHTHTQSETDNESENERDRRRTGERAKK